jgi:hypothetical protein
LLKHLKRLIFIHWTCFLQRFHKRTRELVFRIVTRLLLLRHLDISQPLDLELLPGGTAVDVAHVVGRGLKVRGGVVALGDEDVVGGAVFEGCVQRDGCAL